MATRAHEAGDLPARRRPDATDLHTTVVVEKLGIDKAVPSRILENMGINLLTRHNIASYLPSVEYKGVIPPDQLQDKKIQLEKQANELISKGAKVLVSVFAYEEAAKLCGGALPSYISQDSTPRIVKFGDYPGCPCGGTHVADVADIGHLKVTSVRVKKGVTKVSCSISP